MQPRRGEEGRGGGEWRGGEERGGKGRGEGEGTGETGETGERGERGRSGEEGRGECKGDAIGKAKSNQQNPALRGETSTGKQPRRGRSAFEYAKSNHPGRGQPEGRKGGAGGEGQAGKRESSRQSQQAVRLFSAPVDQSDVRTSEPCSAFSLQGSARPEKHRTAPIQGGVRGPLPEIRE